MLVDWGSQGLWRTKVVPKTDGTDYSQPSLDDSGWAMDPLPFGNHPGDPPFYAWPQYWLPERTYLGLDQRLWLRMHIPGGKWQFWCRHDDAYTVYLNGTALASNTQYGDSGPVNFQGGGVLAVQTWDTGASVCYGDARLQGGGGWVVGAVAAG